MKLNQLEKEIFKEYKCIFKKYPDWAFRLCPTIPLIGDKIDQRKRVISYASAENITSNDYRNEYKKLEKLSDDVRFHRGRHYQNRGKYFRYTHINPFDTGAQYIVTWFILKEIGLDGFSNQPYNFAEEIAVANISKFTIKRDKKVANIDPSSWEHFKPSIPYLVNDFKIIKPDIVIIPETRFRIVQKEHGWKKIKTDAHLNKEVKFVKIYQVVPQNTNTRGCKEGNLDVSPIKEWLDNCQNNLENHLRLLKKEIKNRIEKI